MASIMRFVCVACLLPLIGGVSHGPDGAAGPAFMANKSTNDVRLAYLFPNGTAETNKADSIYAEGST